MVKVKETKRGRISGLTLILESEKEILALFHAVNYCGAHYLDYNETGPFPYNMTKPEYSEYRDKIWEAISPIIHGEDEDDP